MEDPRARDVLRILQMNAVDDNERWFPDIHDEEKALIPIAIHHLISLTGEVGELANKIKKKLRRMEPLTPVSTAIREELADVFTYLMSIAQELDVNLADAYYAKRAKNEERFGSGSNAPETS